MLVVAQHGSTADKQYNWSYSVNYDEDTNIIQLSKQYLDNLGRSTQSMSKNLAANKVMATETVYDQYGRAVISTLPAPIGQDMVIRNNFITNNTGVPYSWQHFDDALLNNPAPVGKDSTNTLGIFYSSNGSEDYVATSSYPYSRVEYMADPTGRVKRGAAPGEQLKMGSGKENQMYYMFTAGELDRAYGVDSSFYCDITLQNPIHSAALSNTEIVAEKTISIDAEGTISISFISDGLTIASCVSGMSPTPSVPEQSALNTLLYAGTRSADIHLPLAKSTTLKLPLPTYRVPFGVLDDGIVDSNEINYSIMDLTTNQLLQINTDYTIGSNRFVTFSGNNKHRFLRISYDYTQTKLDFFTSIGANPPNAKLEYKLDYSHFSVNYYDFSGRLRANVSPKGFDYSVNGKHTEYSRYDYNPLGLVITKQLPDEGLTEFLYSDEGVLRFSQNAQQKQEDKFSYFRYDTENRIIEKGEYIENGGSTYEFAGYYDEANTGTDVKTITDSVSKQFTTQTHHEHYVAYDLLASVAEIPSAYSYKSNFAQSNLKGKASKTWNENHQTWYSYDYAGRLTFTVQELLDTNFNTDVDETIKTVNYTYAPVTSVILKEEYQKYHATEKTTNLYTYNASTQPITVVVKDAANQTIGQADFEYYLNGQLKRKILGHHLQGIDYIYTLNGALKSMNHPTLQPEYDPGNDGGESGIPADLFAFAIDYHENDYVRTGSNVSAIVQDGYYNGLIKAVRWKMKDENEIYQSSGNIELYDNEEPDISLMYQYTYDKFYRLETANFGIFNGSDFDPRDHYKVYGGSSNDGIDYDIIGNIKTLKRNGFDGDYDLLMDDMEYNYTSGTSKLSAVDDQSTSTYSNDFNTDNGSTFLYNENGQMTAAYPDGVDHILYYPSGLIKQLINSNGDTISYVYNEQGKKIKTIFVDVQNYPNITTSTWYFTDAMGKVHGVYEKIDTAAVNLTTQVLYAGGRLAVVSNNLVNYELTDHLGNVRVTFADTSSTSTPELMVTSWTDYYPFGEVLPGRSSNPEGHLFGYQGQQKAGNNSKWYAFQLRMYNPSLGRWNSTDPYYQHHSPYLAMANNPVSFVDPDGGRAEKMNFYQKARHANYLRRLRDWWLGNHIKHKAIGGGLFWHQMNLDLLGYTNASMMTLEEARDFFGERTGEALYPGNKGESDNSGALIAMANMQTTLLSLNEWSGNLTIETDAMIAANNEIINNINNSVADREVMNLVIDGVISNDAINLPTYYHIEGADNDKRYREHVRYFSDGLDLDHYNLMNNPIVQAVHGATNESAQFIRELVEAASLVTGVGAVVRAGVGITVKLLARQAAKQAARHAAKASTQGGLNLFKWGAPQTTKATGWKTGDYMLHLPNKGTPKLNWKANYGSLRKEMGLGKPIFDSYRLPNGNLIPTGGFLNAERFILQSRGWIYNPSSGAWMPPGF